MRSTIALVLLLASAANAGIILGPEHLIAPLTTQPSAIGSDSTALATSGDGFLAVWTQRYWPGQGRVIVRAIAPDGTPGSTTALPLPGFPDSVSVCWNGSSFVVIWHDGDALFAATVNRKAEVVGDPQEIVAGEVVALLGSASNGDRTLVMYSAAEGTSGVILDGSARPVLSGISLFRDVSPLQRDLFSFVSDSHDFLAFHSYSIDPASETSRVEAIRIAPSGQVVGGPGIVTTASSIEGIDAAWSGDRAALVIADRTNFEVATLRTFLVDGSFRSQELPPIPYDGSRPATSPHLVVWNGRIIVYRTIARPPDFIHGDLQLFDFSTDTQSRVALDDFPGIETVRIAAGSQLFGVTSSVAGFVVSVPLAQAMTTVPLAAASNMPSTLAVAALGNQALAVWAFESKVLCRRLAPDGSALDVQPIAAGDIDSAQLTFPGTVVAAGDSYWIVWRNVSSVVFRRLRQDGTFASDAVATPLAVPLIATNGSELFGLGRDGSRFTSVRYSPNGDLIAVQPLPIDAATFLPQAITSNGSDFLIAFLQEVPFPQNPLLTQNRIVALRVDAAGNALDPDPIEITSYRVSSQGAFNHVQVASDGRDYVIGYGQGADARARRLLREGSLADSTAEQDGILLEEQGGIDAIAPATGGTLFLINRFSASHLRLTNGSGLPAGAPSDDFSQWGGSLALLANGTYVLGYVRSAEDPLLAGALEGFVRIVDAAAASRARAVRH